MQFHVLKAFTEIPPLIPSSAYLAQPTRIQPCWWMPSFVHASLTTSELLEMIQKSHVHVSNAFQYVLRVLGSYIIIIVRYNVTVVCVHTQSQYSPNHYFIWIVCILLHATETYNFRSSQCLSQPKS